MPPILPDLVNRWIQSVEDPWSACGRADWLVYVARARGVSAQALIAALARCVPLVEYPREYMAIGKAVFDLIHAYASGEQADDALTEEIRLRVKPTVIDWNLGRSYGVLASHGASTPEGFPPPAPKALEPLRATANAALRLHRAAEQHRAGDEQWHAGLSLVALHIVFRKLGSGGHPIFNYVEREGLPDEVADAHRAVCAEVRALLEANDQSSTPRLR